MSVGDPHSPVGQTTTSILVWLAEYGPATAAEAARACDMHLISMRGRLVMLVRQGLVSGQPNGARPPRQAYAITAEGRRKAGISDARHTANS